MLLRGEEEPPRARDRRVEDGDRRHPRERARSSDSRERTELAAAAARGLDQPPAARANGPLEGRRRVTAPPKGQAVQRRPTTTEGAFAAATTTAFGPRRARQSWRCRAAVRQPVDAPRMAEQVHVGRRVPRPTTAPPSVRAASFAPAQRRPVRGRCQYWARSPLDLLREL